MKTREMAVKMVSNSMISVSHHYYIMSDLVEIKHQIISPPPSARQHPSYGDCMEVKREYYQNGSVLDCVTQCSQSAANFYEQFLYVQQIGFVTLGPLRRA